MFVALREIRTARGRFALMVAVVAMITVLLAVLTALTQGLGRQSTSAIEALLADRVALTPTVGSAASYGDSVVTRAQLEAFRETGAQVEPLAIGHARVEVPGSGQAASVALWGTTPGGMAAAGHPLAAGTLVLPADTAGTLGVEAGAMVRVAGKDLRVAAVEPTAWYSHSPVARVDPATFGQLSPPAPGTVGSVLLVRGGLPDGLAERTGTVAPTVRESLSALPGYRSERSSLLLIQAFLYGISALVVMAFVSVWTIQRTRDLAVLRALGASPRYVLRDALGQASLLLAVGTLAGGALGLGLAHALRDTAPVAAGFQVAVLPVLGIAGLGLAASFLATRRVARVDPLLALGGS